ncbi:MAG: class I SAM-dependent methyltransferase [SAR324 cluster bacterium]|nr:class I SAM-dependent methyltransferase [SAR324 cluster bacterium]MBL7035720.1 class I SAM-dependent methyltransferase [SAR324 cluster bacterium]
MPINNSHIDLEEIEKYTIAHYDDNAESFRVGTQDHDVSQNIAALLDVLPKDKSLDILDFGCGPGRDMCVFKAMGHNPVGLDGSMEFCKMAEMQSGCPTLNQQFLELDLEENCYDGIFANASLFHVPSQELPRVLTELHSALRTGGILFFSNPRGNAEGWQGQRYGNYMEFEASELYLEQSGFKIVDHFYRPAGKSRDEQPWLAIVSQREV